MVLVVLIFYFIVILGVLVFYVSLLLSNWSEAPFVPTGRKDMRLILQAAHIRPGEFVYDLGSGDGRVVRAAARMGAQAIGYERSRVLTVWSRFVAAVQQVPARFIRADYLRGNFSNADVIFCYLMPKAMEKLKAKFERELRPGTRIFSRAFKVPGWTPRARLKFSKRGPPVYLYIVS